MRKLVVGVYLRMERRHGEKNGENEASEYQRLLTFRPASGILVMSRVSSGGVACSGREEREDTII
jgi:hypothetical protein